MVVAETVLLLSTKPSSYDHSGFMNSFEAEISLPITPTTPTRAIQYH